MSTSTLHLGIFYMPQIYDTGPTALLPLRRKACWGFFFSPLKNPTASAGFEPANLGTKGQHATPRPLIWAVHLLSYCYYFRSTGYDIYLLTAIGLSPGDSSTVHIYTQTIHRTTQNKQYVEQHNNLGKCGPCPVLARFTLAFALQLRKKHGKTSVRVAESENT